MILTIKVDDSAAPTQHLLKIVGRVTQLIRQGATRGAFLWENDADADRGEKKAGYDVIWSLDLGPSS